MGGAATALTEVDTSKGELYHTWPSFIQDGEHFLYFRSGTPDVAGVYAGSINVKPAEQSGDRILATDFAASYANGGSVAKNMDGSNPPVCEHPG